MRVVFVTAEGAQIALEDVDRSLHEASFADRGVELEYRYWSDPGVDWASYDLMVIRSTWDYAERVDEFMAWLDSVSHLRCLQNPAEMIRWNLDKRYLLELANRGVPVVDTVIVESIDRLDQAWAHFGDTDVVVKPVVSAGSRLTGWFDSADPAARELAAAIFAEGNKVMLEPFISSVATNGEVSVIFFDGEYSHSLRKGPLLERGGGLIGGAYTEVVTAHDPDPPEMDIALGARDVVMELSGERGWLPSGQAPLYSRFDMVSVDDARIELIEVELFEPSLFLELSLSAPDAFTDACVKRATALGQC